MIDTNQLCRESDIMFYVLLRIVGAATASSIEVRGPTFLGPNQRDGISLAFREDPCVLPG
jgi:hypothetical protein